MDICANKFDVPSSDIRLTPASVKMFLSISFRLLYTNFCSIGGCRLNKYLFSFAPSAAICEIRLSKGSKRNNN